MTGAALVTTVGAQEPSTRAAAHGAQEAAPVSRTLRLARPAAGRLLWASLLGAGAVAASIGLLASAAWLISRAAQHPGESALGIAIVVVQFCGLSRGIFRYFERLVGHEAAFRALADLRVSFFRRLEPLAPAGLPAFRRGDLVARLVRDVDEQQDVLLRVWPPMVIAALVGPVTVAFVWWLLPAAGLALGACLLLAATAVPWLTGRLARRTEARQAGARGELTTTVVDLIEGAPDLVAYGAVGPQLARVHAADAELSRLAAGSAGTTGVGLGLATLLAGTAMWAGLVLGVAAVHSGRLGGVWLATVALVPLAAFELVAPLPAATQALQRCRRSARRLFGVMDAPVPVADPIEPRPLPAAPRSLETDPVSARYPGAREPAVVDVTLSVPPGHRVAVVGPSGAGKSSLAYVCLRFLPYEHGSVRLGDVELDRLAGDDVRTAVGYVAQDAHLFDTTVAQNLRVGRRDASGEELREALGRVGLLEWLDGLPEGLETDVGPAGSRLSGGQRRRIVVARALLARFDLLVLDEPTEHLDMAAADALTTDLLTLTRGRSTILVTHRLGGLEAVDEVVLLDGGRVVERGTHARLLASGGRYATLWRAEGAVPGSRLTAGPPEFGRPEPAPRM